MTANPLTPLTPAGATAVIGPAPPAALPGRFTPLDPVRVLRQYAKYVILASVIGFALGVGLFFLMRRFTPEYQSTSQLLVTGSVTEWDEKNLPDGRSRISGDILSALINNQIILLRSDDILGEALKRDAVRATAWHNSFNDPTLRLKTLREQLSAVSPHGSNLIAVQLSGRYPHDLPTILDAVIEVYLLRYRGTTEEQSGTLRKVFFDERRRAEEEARQLFEQLKRYKTEHQLPDLEGRSNDASIAYGELATARIRLQPALEQAQEAYNNLVALQKKGDIVPTPEEIASVERDPGIRDRYEKLRSLREQRQALLEKFGENHRAVRDIDSLMLAVEQEKKSETDRLLREQQAVQVEAARKTIEALQGQMAGMQMRLEEARKRVQDITEQISEYKRLQQLADEAIHRRDQLQEKLDHIRIINARPDIQAVAVYLRPTPPELTSPKFAGITAGTTVLFGGAVLLVVFLKELLDQRVKSPQDMKLIPNVDLLGIIPDSAEDPLGPVRIENAVQTDPSGLIAESFRQVRMALLAQIDRRGYKTLMLVCAHGGCGTSTLVNNLGLSLAYNGRRVLVIDANLRRPVQHELFATPATPGLVEVLRGTATLDTAITHRDEPSLDILPAGDAKDSPPEVMESPAFRELLSQLETRYDLILIDAPPALLTSESQLLSRNVDAIAVVVRAALDKRGSIGRMLRQLEGHRADLLGAVLNGVRSSAGGYFRKNYEEFYRYREGVLPVKQITAQSPTATGGGDGESQ